MARKKIKTDLQRVFENYARTVLVPQVTRLFTVPAIGFSALESTSTFNHNDVMAELVFDDENVIERAKETYRRVLANEIEKRFSPGQRTELENSIPQLVKNYGIALAGMRTRKRRENQICRTFDVKLYPKRKTEERLLRMRLEAKWLYNDILDKGEKGYDTSPAEIEVWNPKLEERFPREIKVLTARERQSVLTQIRTSISSLATSKGKGCKVGRLKFKSRIDTILLDQYGVTHIVRDDYKHVHIAGIDKDIYARGLEQLAGWEITVAKLMWLADGLHLKVTAYKDKEKVNETPHQYRKRGTLTTFDFGVHDQLTFGDGTIVNLLFENSQAWRRADRKMSAQKKGSQGRKKTNDVRKKAALRDTYRKDDAANKVCALVSKNEVCITQDDNLASWKRGDSFAHGSKKIQHGIAGRVKSKLEERGGVFMIDRWSATTQVCPRCHEKTKHDLSEQENIVCGHCGYEYPRNAGAAWSMEAVALEEFGDVLPKWFSPIEVADSIDEMLELARRRSAWDKNMTRNISDPRVLDEILGHVDDKTHVGEDMSGRVEPRERNGWISKKKSRGKTDKWAKHSKNYESYVRIGAEPAHAEAPVEMVSSRDTEEGRHHHNKSRSRARADRRAYRWAKLKRERRAKEHDRCAKRDEKRLAAEKSKKKADSNNHCTLGTRGINAGGDGQKPLRVCRSAASSKNPEAATSGID